MCHFLPHKGYTIYTLTKNKATGYLLYFFYYLTDLPRGFRFPSLFIVFQLWCFFHFFYHPRFIPGWSVLCHEWEPQGGRPSILPNRQCLTKLLICSLRKQYWNIELDRVHRRELFCHTWMFSMTRECLKKEHRGNLFLSFMGPLGSASRGDNKKGTII